MTGRKHENTVHLIHSFSGYSSAGIGAEVAAGLYSVLFVGYPGIFLIGNAYIVIALVVLKQYIVLGLVLFYKAAFQQQGFIFTVSHDKIVIVYIGYHCCDLSCMVGILTKIAADTVVKVLCLANVDYPVLPVSHYIYSGRLGEP